MIAAFAQRQHGVIAAWQLVRLGFDAKALRYRAKVERLHRLHHGVYAVGHTKLTREGHWMAAVLAYGPDAVLSHRTAAALWEIGKSWGKLDVTTPHSRRSRARIRAHTAPLPPEDLCRRSGIPVTSVARTILDVAGVLDEDRLTRVIEDAVRARLFHLPALDHAIARRPRARGVKRLRAVLADYRETDLRSELERDFRALIQQAGLPEPGYNVLVAGVLVDAFWPSWQLVVELDGRVYHTSPRAFERDRVRDATLQKANLHVLRITHRRLTREPATVLADIMALRQ